MSIRKYKVKSVVPVCCIKKSVCNLCLYKVPFLIKVPQFYFPVVVLLLDVNSAKSRSVFDGQLFTVDVYEYDMNHRLSAKTALGSA